MLLCLLEIGSPFNVVSQSMSKVYTDTSHYSTTFNGYRNYRVYLPEGYGNEGKRYPVIYFFHGYGGRHNQDYNALLEYEMLGQLVDKFQVILVMWDGRIKESLHRPYNIGGPEHVQFSIQMKDYFPELVSHIDSSYQTLTDRENRGIIGYSMGGFMSFFIAGTYPHMVSAAVNMTGSTEFFVGYPEHHTLYPLRYTFDNLNDVKIRLHNSSVGELSSQNREVYEGALWQGNMDIEYWEFPGGHKVDEAGETEVFRMAMDFVDRAFRHPEQKAKKWSHLDLYSDFNVWGYSIKSSKKSSGFTYLRDVAKDGFGFFTKKWLPIAPPITDYYAVVTTPDIYEPGVEYQINDYQKANNEISISTQKANDEGRLTFNLDGLGHEIGIVGESGRPRLVFANYDLPDGKRLIRTRIENRMTIQLVNLGKVVKDPENVTFSLESTDGSIVTSRATYSMTGTDRPGMMKSEPITFSCYKQPPLDGAPYVVKCILNVTYDSLTFREKFDVPVFFDVSAFQNIEIDDGRQVRDSIFGIGNGDGIITPGERVMIYTSGHRTQLFYDDPYVEVLEEELYMESLPAKWGCDGITSSSIIKISEDCPDNYQIELLAKYETKDYMPMKRRCYWGKINLEVKRPN